MFSKWWYYFALCNKMSYPLLFIFIFTFYLHFFNFHYSRAYVMFSYRSINLHFPKGLSEVEDFLKYLWDAWLSCFVKLLFGFLAYLSIELSLLFLWIRSTLCVTESESVCLQRTKILCYIFGKHILSLCDFCFYSVYVFWWREGLEPNVYHFINTLWVPLTCTFKEIFISFKDI